MEEFASAETLMNSSLLVSATLKTSTIGEVALACFENTNEVPVAIVDEKTKVLIGAIFREDLFEKTKSTNCNAPTTNREEEDAKAEGSYASEVELLLSDGSETSRLKVDTLSESAP